jgi:ankyrin repeat protein
VLGHLEVLTCAERTLAPMSEEPSADVRELATRVFDMARDGDAASLAAYLDAGVPVDLTNDKGDTLVMLAAYHGHADTVAVLTARGADVDRLNDRGQAPVAGAVFKGEDAVVRVLVEAGADPLAGHPTAVDTARMFGREDLLALLTTP